MLDPAWALKVEAGEVELVGALQRREGDRHVLDRGAGRVEDGDLVVAPPAVGVARQNVAEPGDVVARETARVDRVRELAVVRRLL